jgi:NADH-quinone oxidoreductase subunit E
MKIDITNVDAALGTIAGILDEKQKKRGLLIHAFHQIQKEHNYLPEEELKKLSKTLSVPISDVYSTEDMSLTLETVGCVGCCGLAPVVTVNEEVVGEVDFKKFSELSNDIRSKK